MEQNNYTGKILAEWHFPEFTKHDKSHRWYWIMFAIALVLLIIAMITKNFLFAVIIVMFVVIVLLQDRKEPSELIIHIMETGIRVDEKFLLYKDIRNFFILYEPPTISNLFIRPKNKLTPALNIPLVDQNPMKIRELLINFLPEDLETEEEPTSDFLARILKL